MILYRHPRNRSAFEVLVLLMLVATGCHSIGPSAVRRDRLHYSSAVAESWKEQLLLNIVKTRYGDAPAFLEVVSVVSGYTLETGVSLGGQFSPQSLSGDTFAAGGVSGTYTDRPTISYSPMSGEKFARSLMAPVPLDALWSVIQGGVPPDFLLGLTLESVEGHHNLGLYAGRWTPMDPGFLRLMELIRLVRNAHVTDSELIREGDHLDVWLQFHELKASQSALAPPVAELKDLLGIPAVTNRVKLRFATYAPEPGVVGMRSRSLMQILSTLGAGVRFPPERLARGGIVPAE
ncbi:MAG: hypothetical protein JNL10_09200, partial [Verrucomicrobiales bacterium]|nr:hypothetical protein [Verrucomicrobiales bacterium]